MATFKMKKPHVLATEGVTDAAFKVWSQLLECHLETNDNFLRFMPDGDISTWKPAEELPKRINALPDGYQATQLLGIQRDLKQFINVIASYIHLDYFQDIERHCTSLKWIYDKLKEDLDIKSEGINFINISKMSFDPAGDTTPQGFYNAYRGFILNSLLVKDTVIKWKNKTLDADETISPTFENYIFLQVLEKLHPKLPAYIQEKFSHKIGENDQLMDYKKEILKNALSYIQDIEAETVISAATKMTIKQDDEAKCNYIRPQQQQRQQQPPRPPNYRPSYRTNNNNRPNTYNKNPFCRVCQLNRLPRSTFTSHYPGDPACTSMSESDKRSLRLRMSTPELKSINQDDDTYADDVLAENGYLDETEDQVKIFKRKNDLYFKLTSQQISDIVKYLTLTSDFSPMNLRCNIIRPVPTQILTVQDANHQNVHLDLDSGATVSYVKHSAVLYHDFIIYPNSQLSFLADGKTKMKSAGEIDVTFTRNSWSVRFHAIVVYDLHCNFVAGTNFLLENKVTQNIADKTITVQGKFTVPETNKNLIFPTVPNNIVAKNNSVKILLPGQSISYDIPHSEGQQVAVLPWYDNKSQQWPTPQLCQVTNGKINITNEQTEPINIKKEAPRIQIRPTSENDIGSIKHRQLSYNLPHTSHDKNTDKIIFEKQNIEKEALDIIEKTHTLHSDVFDENLSGGYNQAFGRHVCELNWANNTRPPATKVHTPNYDHQTKVLLQQVCDDFTQQGVLGVPQEDGVKIQHVSPIFLVNKQRAKGKQKSELTTSDVRLVANFGKLNQYLVNMPSPVTKSKDIFYQIGKWNHIITTDLYQGFYQNIMSKKYAPWLGVNTPFGGLRYFKRSGQGLIAQSEELDELLAKVLKNEMQQGIVARIADDLYIGGKTQKETAENYQQIISKLSQANLKLSAAKTNIFPKSVTILGWIWSEGGYLSASPHRTNALKNIKVKDIKTIKDMRSFTGLFKTLLPASKDLTLLLDPFDKTTADKESKEPFVWDKDLEIAFEKAQKAVDSLQTLYLPKPSDQLMIVCDAAKKSPGIGHVLYAIVENKKIPVSFYSSKLSEHHSKWLSCEIEALAFANAIQSEYSLIKETTKPVIIAPDSKPVVDAINLVKKGHFSSNPRLQSLITNVNRIPIIVQIASGKNNLNLCADFQSRNPSNCESEYCSICRFVEECSIAALDPLAINKISTTDPTTYNNRTAWAKIQDEDKASSTAKSLLSTSKTPSKQTGKIYSDIRKIHKIAEVAADGLLIVKSKPTPFSSQIHELIVVPTTHVPAVLWQIHNNMNHPAKSQLKAQFERTFFAVGLQSEIDKIYNNCHFCATQKKIPLLFEQNTATDVNTPGTHFHADVIKRSSQKILILRDHFSSFTTATIIKSETHQELRKGIIDLVIPIRINSTTYIKTDNATGFSPLINGKDAELEKLNIKLTQSDPFNKNENAVVDRACNEIEKIICALEPDGRPISNCTLQHAVTLLNSKLRRGGKLSAMDIHFNRDMSTGDSLNLNYKEIKKDQHETRQYHNNKNNQKIPKTTAEQPNPGDIVTVKIKDKKHTARDSYLVTENMGKKSVIHKIIHQHSTDKANLRSKSYITDNKRLHVVKANTNLHNIPKPVTKLQKHSTSWNPIDYDTESEHEEDYLDIPITRPQVHINDIHTDQPSTPDSPTSQCPSPDSSQQTIEQNSENITNENNENEPQEHFFHERNQKRPTPVPRLYAALNLREKQIQAAAKASRKRALSEPTRNSPPGYYSPPAKESRTAKILARQHISNNYSRRPSRPFPQFDGANTEPSSLETSPETFPSFRTRLLSTHSSITSTHESETLEWNDEYDFVRYPDYDIFDDYVNWIAPEDEANFTLNVSIDSPSEITDFSKVYKLDKVLDKFWKDHPPEFQ